MSRFLAERLAALEARHSELERRLENTHRKGKVLEVNEKKGVARLEVGVDADGTPQKGPWVKFSQQMGKVKIHAPVTVGQTMMQIAPGGDFEQAFLIPLGASDSNASPGDDENPVITYGDKNKVSFKDDDIHVESPNVRVTASENATVTAMGNAKVTAPTVDVLGDDQVNIIGGGTALTVGASGVAVVGGGIDFQTDYVRHRGVNIGDDHVHGGVVRGGDDTFGPH